MAALQRPRSNTALRGDPTRPLAQRLLLADALLRRPDLIRAGTAGGSIGHQVAGGELERVYTGCYLPAEAARSADLDQQALARIRAVAGRSPSLVVSHVSAARQHGLPLPSSAAEPVHLTRNAATGGRRGQARTVHAARLREEDVTSVAGLLVTTPARTVLDLGCTADQQTALGAADCALHTMKVSPSALATVLEIGGSRRGIGRARHVLAFADGRAESVGESALRWVMSRLGLPVPELQVLVHAADGTFIGRVDLAYPQFAVIIEFDGDVKYGDLVPPGRTVRDVVIAEKQRESKLIEAGFIVIRIVWADLFDSARLDRRIRDAIKRGRRARAAGLVSGRLIPTAPIRLP